MYTNKVSTLTDFFVFVYANCYTKISLSFLLDVSKMGGVIMIALRGNHINCVDPTVNLGV